MEITKVHDISILHLFGEVSFMELDRIEKALNSCKRTNNNKILIDMTSVDYVHYLVIRRLMEQAGQFRKDHGDIKLVSANHDAKDMIKFTGADQVLEDYASISEAILSFLKQNDACDADYQ